MTRERYNRILRTIKTAMYAGGGFDDLTFQRTADAVWAVVEPLFAESDAELTAAKTQVALLRDQIRTARGILEDDEED